MLCALRVTCEVIPASNIAALPSYSLLDSSLSTPYNCMLSHLPHLEIRSRNTAQIGLNGHAADETLKSAQCGLHVVADVEQTRLYDLHHVSAVLAVD